MNMYVYKGKIIMEDELKEMQKVVRAFENGEFKRYNMDDCENQYTNFKEMLNAQNY